MTRRLLFFALFAGLAVLQTSFFSSLPGWLAFMPVVPAVAVYLLQHEGIRSAAYGLVGFGLFLDVLAIPSFPPETLSYAAAAGVTVLAAHHVFSNRSWYGLAACGLFSTTALFLVRGAVLAVAWMGEPTRVSWPAYGQTFFWNAVLMVALLSAFLWIGGRKDAKLRNGTRNY